MPDEGIFEVIESECRRIDQLFAKYQPLLEKIKDREPDFIEIGSLAMMLHSFYNGLENIFSRIARKIDRDIMNGTDWHKDLLERMSKETDKRKTVVLSGEMSEELKKYLGFRHFSRHAYAFDLQWNLMKELVFRADDVKNKVLAEIKIFIEHLKTE